MSSHADEGLLLSLLVYLAAVASVLALFVVPVVWANGPTVMENAGAEYARELLTARRSDGMFPVARLNHQKLVPERVVELAAHADHADKAQRARDRAEPARDAHLARQQRAVQRARIAERARRAQRAARSFARLPQRRRSSGALSSQY